MIVSLGSPNKSKKLNSLGDSFLGLVGQLLILGHISYNFTLLTTVSYFRTISHIRVLQYMCSQKHQKKVLKIHYIYPEDPFFGGGVCRLCPNMVNYSQSYTDSNSFDLCVISEGYLDLLPQITAMGS